MPTFDAEVIRQALPIEKLLEAHGVALRRGRGPCLVCGTSQKSTSFSVRGPQWRCFACNERGDVIDLMARLDGVSLGRAFERSAAFAGIRPLKPGEAIPHRATTGWQLAKQVRDRAWSDYLVARRQREWAGEQFEYFAHRRGLDDPYTVLASEVLATSYDAELFTEYRYDLSLEAVL